jgi:probable F420-dependent oxidoreductase
MPWSHPAARMREFILAMRAIWANWKDGTPLAFTGKFYTHTLMTPFFTPTNKEYGGPRVWLAAVGPKMAEVAGEVADGVIIHAFTTEKYLRETTLPALEKGFRKAGKKRSDFEISYPVFVCTGRDEKELATAKVATRRQIAFYGSTPAYKPVLDSIGVGELQDELNKMSKQGRWEAMGDVITEDILDKFAVVGEPSSIAKQISARYGDIIDRTSAAYANLAKNDRAKMIADLKAVNRR